MDSETGQRLRGVGFALVALALLGLLFVPGCGENLSEGRTPQIGISPNPVSFPLGEEAQRPIEIRNTGTGTLRLEQFRWGGDFEAYSIAGLEPFELDSGESRTVLLAYAPDEARAGEATLTFIGNTPNDGSNVLRMTTSGESSLVQVIPNPVQITTTDFGSRVEVPVTVENIGNRPFEVTGIETFMPTVGFEVVEAPEASIDAPLTVAPTGQEGSTFQILLGYTAEDIVNTTGELILRCTAENCAGNRYIVEIQINSLAGELFAEPDPVLFGPVPYDDPVERVLTIRNTGSADLVIDEFWLRNLSSAADAPETPADARIERVDGAPYDRASSGMTLEAEETAEIVLSYAPRVGDPDARLGLSAEVVFVSNDPFQQPEATVFVGGSPAAPILVVEPGDEIDFGIIARGITARRALRFRNVGSATLTVGEVCLPREQQFAMSHAGGLTAGPGTECPGGGQAFGPLTIAPDEFEEFTVSFTTPQDAPFNFGYQDAVFYAGVNDPRLQGGDLVTLRAIAGQEPVCEMTFFPSSTSDWGQVIRGTSNDRVVTARITGSGPCNVLGAQMQTNLFNVLPGSGQFFSFQGTTPSLPLNGLVPGEEFDINVRYAPTSSSAFGDDARDEALLGFDVRDPNAGNEKVQCGVQGGGFNIPFPGQDESICNLRLRGSSGVAELATIPGRFDAGAVTLGCNSQTETITAHSIGNAPVVVEGIELQGCNNRFQLAGVPALPRTMQPQDTFPIQVRYRPNSSDNGVATSCRIVFTGQMSGGQHIVPLRGEGTDQSRQIDRFTQNSGQDVDILMVVDNSGSMGNLQNSFRTRVQNFVNRADVFSSNFQVGVVTTQSEGTIPHQNFSGSRNPGELLGDPRIITNQTPNYRQQIQTTTLVGVSNSPESAIERGFESARIALSDPLITDLNEDCSACQEPYMCVSGGCGGFNRGFIRDGASLQLIFFSDEEEQSRGTVDFYVEFFQSLKGMRNTRMFAAHSISGPANAACDGGAGDGGADRAPRYVEITERTGGVWGSICEDFTSTLEDIADIAFQAQVEFFLTRVADPATLQVRVNGQARQPGTHYTYHANSNSIVWQDSAIPAPGTDFEVEYEARCF